jgi:hypothetical protein
MSEKMISILRGVRLIFIQSLNNYSVTRGEPERMLGNHKESSTRSWVTSRTFQRVEVPLGRIF